LANDSNFVYNIASDFAPPPEKIDAVNKILVISDVHGQLDVFLALLQSHNIVDDNYNWNWDTGHLVVLGDIFDRGDFVNEVSYLIYRLEQQAKSAGGGVHLLLGNHEIMVLQDDIRYVTEKYRIVASAFGISVPELYNNNTLIGRWLRSKNTIMQINDFLFVHGGIHPQLMNSFISINNINSITRNNIDTPRDSIRADSLLSFIFRSDGPHWYRGFFEPDSLPEVSEIELDQLLDYLNVKKIIVGHTTMESIATFYDNQVIMVDGGIKYGEKGEALLWEHGEFYRIFDDGSKILIID
jgi:hypothetical protein